MLKIDLKPKEHVLAQFAWVALFGLPLIAGVVLKFCGLWSWTTSWTHPAMLCTAAVGALQLVLFLAGLRAPTRWLFVVLMLVALPVGFVLSHALMMLVYYVVMTPMGLVFRLFGRDAMGRKFDRSKASYWHPRGPARDPASYFKLY